MAKDYFQDIIPHDESGQVQSTNTTGARTLRVVSTDDMSATQSNSINYPQTSVDPNHLLEEEDSTALEPSATPLTPSRGIRSITMASRTRPSQERTPVARIQRPSFFRSGLFYTLLVITAIAILAFAYFATQPSVVIITPRSQSIQFNESSRIVAYPVVSAATNTLSYTVATNDFSDFTDVVQGSGAAVTVDAKASGSVTVYNNTSVGSVKLIKNTRFETSQGITFRSPGEIIVPGMHGTKPGSITVTVIADQPGAQYNIGPTARLTLPGLKSNKKMFSNVYAVSSVAMTGGSSANQAGLPDAQRTQTISDIRARLDQKIRTYVQSLRTDQIEILDGTVQTTYQHVPDAAVVEGSVRISESAHVVVPMISTDLFATAVANAAAIDTHDSTFILTPGTFDGSIASSTDSIGNSPLYITLTGATRVVWRVDTARLAHALAGLNSVGTAFNDTITRFPSIQEAQAHIAPVWSHTFQSDTSKIQIIVSEPKSTTASSTQNIDSSHSGV